MNRASQTARSHLATSASSAIVGTAPPPSTIPRRTGLEGITHSIQSKGSIIMTIDGSAANGSVHSSNELSSLPETMRASVLLGPGKVVIEERPVPSPGPGEVLIQIGSVGICGSDVHYYQHGRIAEYVVREPLILGHEAGGRIVAVGTGVDQSRIGERVALEPGVPCRVCRECKAGRYNLCRDVRFFATPPIDGTFAEYVALEADFAHPIPDSLAVDAGIEVDAYIDCSGAPPAINQGIRALRPAGSVVLVGMGADEISLPVGIIQGRELTITGTFRYANTYPTAIALAASGKIDLDGMVTTRYTLDEAETALSQNNDPTAMKIIVQPGKTSPR